MDQLEQARAEINEVDAQIASLFERRMAAVKQVLEYKREHGLPVLDAGREKEVLARAAQRIRTPLTVVSPSQFTISSGETPAFKNASAASGFKIDPGV